MQSNRYKCPEAAESRLVYSTPSNPQLGYAESRPAISSRADNQSIQAEDTASYSKQQNSPESQKLWRSKLHESKVQGAGARPDGDKGREQEVDALTTLLMQNMEAAAHPDFFGMCAKCGRAIMGETDGCKALDQLFHVDCFTCIACSTCLKGQPFYAMEGRPYCEPCYVTTLEECSVCSKPITDRILRATGKAYHPKCFLCVVCGKALDGVPFTVDATNQIHCLEDFYRKFAPRCCVCDKPIMPEEGKEEALRVMALDRSFHPSCYKCEDCGLLLSSEEEGRGCYPLDEHILCKSCNAKRIQRLSSRNL